MKTLWLTILLVTAAALIGIVLWFQWATSAPEPQAAIDLEGLLTDGNAGFAEVEGDWPFRFPQDHGAHPDFRTESWYFIGHLQAADGRRFGYQLTFFRLALSPEPPQINSAWATNQVYRSHLALTEVDQNRFHAFERFSRAALGLSGAARSPLRVWLENWEAEIPPEREPHGFQLRAGEGEIELDLQLHPVKAPVLPDSGTTGLGENTFYFYLLPRMAVQGMLQTGEETLAVEGIGWLDRAWGLVPVSQGQIALNRFVLQLDDGRELLLFQLHRRDGSGQPVTTGLLIAEDGSTRALNRRDLKIEALEHWESPLDDARYPARWRLRLLDEGLELEIVPYVADQELNLTVRYWGGAVRIAGQDVAGNGFVELTGYGAPEPR